MIRTDYAFKPAARTITFSSPIDLALFGIIVNTIDGIIIYNSMDPTKTATQNGSTLTLLYDTSLMSSTDELQVFYSGSSDISRVFGTDTLTRDGELEVRISDDPISGDMGFIQQHEKEVPNYPARELLTFDTNLHTVIGSQNLIGATTRRLMVEDAIAPEQIVNGSMGALNKEVIIPITGQGTVSAQIWGTWSGSISFYGSVDGQNWNPILGQAPGVMNPFTGTTTNGLFRFQTQGLLFFKLAFTNFLSGIANAILVATPILSTMYDGATAPSTGSIKDALQFPDAWNPRGTYFVNDSCTYNGQIYQCIFSHSALMISVAIPTNTTYWQVDQRQNKSLIANQYVSPPNAARMRIEIDMDAYQYRIAEQTMIDQEMQVQINMIKNDYDLTQGQDSGCNYGKQFAMGQSSGSYYNFIEIR